MTRSITFRRSLFWNLTAGILLLLLVFLSVARLHIEHAEERLATELTGRAVAETRAAVDHFFDPVSKLVVMWGRHFAVAGVDLGDPERLDGYFVPLLATIQHLSGVTLGSEDGRSYTLRRTETGWERRLADPSADPGRVQLLRWSDEDPAGATAWQDASYDPRSRPWFVAALEDRPAARGLEAHAPGDAVLSGGPGELVGSGPAGPGR